MKKKKHDYNRNDNSWLEDVARTTLTKLSVDDIQEAYQNNLYNTKVNNTNSNNYVNNGGVKYYNNIPDETVYIDKDYRNYSNNQNSYINQRNNFNEQSNSEYDDFYSSEYYYDDYDDYDDKKSTLLSKILLFFAFSIIIAFIVYFAYDNKDLLKEKFLGHKNNNIIRSNSISNNSIVNNQLDSKLDTSKKK